MYVWQYTLAYPNITYGTLIFLFEFSEFSFTSLSKYISIELQTCFIFFIPFISSCFGDLLLNLSPPCHSVLSAFMTPRCIIRLLYTPRLILGRVRYCRLQNCWVGCVSGWQSRAASRSAVEGKRALPVVLWYDYVSATSCAIVNPACLGIETSCFKSVFCFNLPCVRVSCYVYLFRNAQ